MKIFFRIIALALLPLITSSVFATDGLYLGHAIGGYQIADRTKISDSTGSTEIKSSGSYFNFIAQLMVGYNMAIKEHFSASIQFDGFLQSGTFNPIYLSNSVNTIKLDEKIPYLYTLSVLPTWEITKVSRIMLKVGYTRGYFELSTNNLLTSADKSTWRDAFNVGIGTELAVTDTIDFRLMGSTNIYSKKQITGLAFNTFKSRVINSQVMAGVVYHIGWLS